MSKPATSAGLQDLDAALAATEKTIEERDKALEERLRSQQADDRSSIAKLIVWSFVILMSWVILAVTVAMFQMGWSELAEPSQFLMSILSSVMLPVVTLVIGYYFGKEK